MERCTFEHFVSEGKQLSCGDRGSSPFSFAGITRTRIFDTSKNTSIDFG